MDNEVQYIFLSKPPAVPSSTITESDWEDLTERVDLLEDGIDLGDLNDVDLTGLADGDTLIYDSGEDPPWVVGTPLGGLTEVLDLDEPVNTAPVTVLDFDAGLTATETTPGTVEIDVMYGGTGAANSVARSDHSHSAVPTTLTTGAATGNLSSGTRALRNSTGPALTNGIDYDVYGIAFVRARNNVDNGIVNLLMRIGTESGYTQRSRSVGTVGGVPVDQIIQFRAVIPGTGSGVTEYFGVQYSSGDATDLRDWEFYAEYKPRR